MNKTMNTLLVHLDGYKLSDVASLSQATGVPFHTIAKIKRRETKNPRIDTVEKLMAHFSRPAKKRSGGA